MRKLIVSMNITLDGFIAGPQQELNWHCEKWCEEMSQCLTATLSKAHTILLGRCTYETMAAFWPTQTNCLHYPREDLAYAVLMNTIEKVVYSNTINASSWNNTKFITAPLAASIKRIKNLSDTASGNIITYGSGKLVNRLMQLQLVDEYQLWLHPVMLGAGRPMFTSVKSYESLQLLSSKVFASGVVLLHYKACYR